MPFSRRKRRMAMAAKAGTRADLIRKAATAAPKKEKIEEAAPAAVPESEVETVPAPETETSASGEYDTSSMTVTEALEVAGDDKDIARQMLDSETSEGGKNRTSLISRLQDIIDQ